MDRRRKFKTDQPSENEKRVRETLINSTGCRKQTQGTPLLSYFAAFQGNWFGSDEEERWLKAENLHSRNDRKAAHLY